MVKTQIKKILIVALVILANIFPYTSIKTEAKMPGVVKLWERNMDLDSTYIRPIIMDSSILLYRDLGSYCCPYLHLLYSLNVDNGNENWQYPTNFKKTIFDIATFENDVYTLEGDKVYYTDVSEFDGREYPYADLKQYKESPDDQYNGIEISYNKLWIGIGKNIFTFDVTAATQTLLQKYSVDGSHSLRFSDENDKYVLCLGEKDKRNDSVFMIDKTTGKTMWEFALSWDINNSIGNAFFMEDNIVLSYQNSEGGGIVFAGLQNGEYKVIWEKKLTSTWAPQMESKEQIKEGKIFIPYIQRDSEKNDKDYHAKLMCLKASDGEVLQDIDVKESQYMDFIAFEKNPIVHEAYKDASYITAYDIKDGSKVWSYQVPNQIGGVSYRNGVICFQNNDTVSCYYLMEYGQK